MRHVNNAEVLAFLRAFKRALSRNDWEIVQRRVSYARITEMTPTSIKQILFELTPDNYVHGPESDRNRKGEYVWIFHKDGEQVPNLDIKLKLVEGHAKVLSFHQSLYF